MKLARILRVVIVVIVGGMALALAAACLAYPPLYVFRVLAWQESDAFDWQKFPSHPLNAAPTPYHFEVAPDPRVAELFGQLAGAADWEGFLAENDTQAFLVIQDGTVLYEAYFNNTQRDSIVTSFSVAKSFVSALVGLAIQDGYIHSVDDAITTYLPELAQRDTRFNDVTIRHLLRMASGFEYEAFRPLLFNSDDPLTTYHPDQRKIAIEHAHIIAPPGQHFHYNKYHPQLLGMILERTTGMTVTEYMQIKLWDPLGMEFAGSWSTDSQASDFERMEAGINARAIDFAKFGVLFVNRGGWQGQQVIDQAWVDESTQPFFPENYETYYNANVASMPGRGYYNYMWWGMERPDGAYDFMAAGDKGQFIYISPAKKLVIVRHGIDYGIPWAAWRALFYEFAGQY